MKQSGRDSALFWILLLLKGATALQTGWDTFVVTRSVLAVILIDLSFVSLWGYLAYAGEGKDARRNKIYATVGAWLLYGAMFVIGFQAHAGQFWALAVRLSGLVALGFDTWQFLSGAAVTFYSGMRQRAKERRKNSLVALHGRLRRRLVRKAYKSASRKLADHVNVAVFEQWRDSLSDTVFVLPDSVPDMPDMSAEGEVVDVRVERVWSKEERQRELPALAGEHDDDELAAIFNVSERTIRRDKAELGLD